MGLATRSSPIFNNRARRYASPYQSRRNPEAIPGASSYNSLVYQTPFLIFINNPFKFAMDEILKLQQQLMAVQEESTQNRLSNRNIVELLDLVQKKHGVRLIFTQDGQEYVTPSFLEQQVRDVVALHGRLNMV